MNYNIKRECWNEKTYNGYRDNPYWRIEFSWYVIGLSDDGNFWGIGNIEQSVVKNDYVRDMLNMIINDCKLQIVLVD